MNMALLHMNIHKLVSASSAPTKHRRVQSVWGSTQPMRRLENNLAIHFKELAWCDHRALSLLAKDNRELTLFIEYLSFMQIHKYKYTPNKDMVNSTQVTEAH